MNSPNFGEKYMYFNLISVILPGIKCVFDNIAYFIYQLSSFGYSFIVPFYYLIRFYMNANFILRSIYFDTSFIILSNIKYVLNEK